MKRVGCTPRYADTKKDYTTMKDINVGMHEVPKGAETRKHQVKLLLLCSGEMAYNTNNEGCYCWMPELTFHESTSQPSTCIPS